MRSACLIFNPVAGQGDPEEDLAKIRANLESEIELDIYLTSEEVGADRLAHEAVQRGVDAVIASGEMAPYLPLLRHWSGLISRIGIISRGTANAFANALELPDTIDAACQAILQGTTRKVDAACCNGQPLVLLAGVGFEAETVEMADREAKNRFGMLAYILAGFRELRNLPSFEVEIETADRVIKTTAAAVTVANAAPSTSILAQGPAGIVVDDGLLDLTIVAPTNVAGAIAAAYHLFQSASAGTPAERTDIGYLRAPKIKITADPPQKVVLDGELGGMTPIEIECIYKGLTVFVPTVAETVPLEKLEGLPNLEIQPKQPIQSE